MEQTKTLPPLVSDEQIETEANEWREGERGITIAHRMCFFSGAEWMRSECEADRQRTREVVQRLVDALDEMKDAFELYASCQCDGTGCPVCRKLDKADNALFVAESMKIKPSRP